jgi:magnesium-protoporphyrin IX monomethyl ester (oxidative) cyclase
MDKPRLRIALVNMPFAALAMPSLALAQLESVLKAGFKDQIHIDTLYLNMDFAAQVGDLSLYHYALSDHGFMTDAGDWLFRQIAFPDSPNNTEAYLGRYYFENNPEIQKARRFLLDQRKGLEKVLDGFIDKHHLLDADVVGFTLLFCQTVASFAMARRLKTRKPSIVTLVGGASCEGEMGQVFSERVSQIDYVFSGPGLVSLPEFVRRRLAGDVEGCDRINGVLSKSNRALWRPAASRRNRTADDTAAGIASTGDELDIDANIHPDYTKFLDTLEGMFPDGQVKPILLFETSRGCLKDERRRCKFCGLNGPGGRYRSMMPEKALDQMRSLYKYVPRSSFFVSVDNVLPRQYLKEVFPRLPSSDGVAIRYEVRPDLSEREIQILCRAGVTRAQPGIESLATPTLKLMQKGTTAFRNIQFLKDCSRHPFSIEWNLLIGSPGESEEVYEKYLRDLPLMMHLPPPVGVFPVMFVRYSHYFDHPERYGLDLRPQDFYSLVFPFDPADVRRVAYHFVDNKSNADSVNDRLDRLNRLVSVWRNRWFNTDGKTQSRLCLLENASEPTVHDSRSGEVVRYRLSAVAKRVLAYLEKPASLSDVAKRFGSNAGFDAGKEMDSLLKRGLLFEEEGRFMSLIAG